MANVANSTRHNFSKMEYYEELFSLDSCCVVIAESERHLNPIITIVLDTFQSSDPFTDITRHSPLPLLGGGTVRAASSVITFRRELNTFLYHSSFVNH